MITACILTIVALMLALVQGAKAIKDTNANLELLAEKHNKLCQLFKDMAHAMDAAGIMVMREKNDGDERQEND